jgi:dolichol-phosphate mannosyltransferase
VEALLALPVGAAVLVVDDASPDGTGDLAEALSREHPGRVSLLRRAGKEGLGRAYAAGFEAALDGGAEVVVQMDCDFSHDPAAVPELLAPLERGEADLVLGCRYTEGGGTAGWSLPRRALSRFGSVYAAAWLRSRVRDLTGGFKAWRAGLLRAVDPGTAAARGYAFQVEMTARALRCGARWREVPIVFRERRAGDSKMSAAVALEAAWRVPLLALRPWRPAAGAPAGGPARPMEDA